MAKQKYEDMIRRLFVSTKEGFQPAYPWLHCFGIVRSRHGISWPFELTELYIRLATPTLGKELILNDNANKKGKKEKRSR